MRRTLCMALVAFGGVASLAGCVAQEEYDQQEGLCLIGKIPRHSLRLGSS